MSQSKVYGQRQVLTPLHTDVSEVVHAAAVEVLLFEGRTTATGKALYQRPYRDFADDPQIEPVDLEVTLVETPRHDRASRGQDGDDLTLTCVVQQ